MKRKTTAEKALELACRKVVWLQVCESCKIQNCEIYFDRKKEKIDCYKATYEYFMQKARKG